MITLTEAQLAEVETLAAVLTAEQTADYFGIGRRTFFWPFSWNKAAGLHIKRKISIIIFPCCNFFCDKVRQWNFYNSKGLSILVSSLLQNF